MPQHHPGTFVAHNNIDLTDVPWALTTHLLSVNHDQLVRVTQHPFLSRAANGTLPKAVVSHWLANDLQYLKVYKGVSEQTLAIVRKSQPTTSVSNPENIETRLIAWLEAAIQNGTREESLFKEVAEIYNLNLALSESSKNEGLRRYEALFRQFATAKRNTFLPWLEGAVLLWATEKVYYDSWRWARRQDAQSSPRTYNKDLDGGAMRREFIPNWSNRDFLMFVEQLERIINEGVSTAVKGNDELWRQIKSRTEAMYAAVLDAEEAFWPDVDESGLMKEAVVGTGVTRDIDGSTLGSEQGGNVTCDKCEKLEAGAVPVGT
jgi:thiaminase